MFKNTSTKFLTVLFSAALVSFACGGGGDEGKEANAPGGSSYLRAKIDGKDWAATEVMPDKYVSEILQIHGSNGNSDLWVQLNEPAPGKTDSLIETDLNHYTDENNNMYMIKKGSTVITKMDDQWVEGTFSFSATDDRTQRTIEATNGSFRVPRPRR